MYFFSETDPNYRVKGSRDPLGFQSIWANVGHTAVKYLSTVSLNLRDFMILSYGIYFFRNQDSKSFLSFFYKFEQACAFARHIHNGEGGFNGIDFVTKNKEKTTFSFSVRSSDTLLSNQRAYGIYGKYIRPYRDMEIPDNEEFSATMEDALTKTSPAKLSKLISRLLEEEICIVTIDELMPLAELLNTVSPLEKQLYRDCILKVKKEHHAQNDLYDLIQANEDLLDYDHFKLHPSIDSMLKKPSISHDLKSSLQYIQNTDRVLHPINRAFVHLLSHSSWTKRELMQDSLMNSFEAGVDYDFPEEVLRELNVMLTLDNYEFTSGIIKRNEAVSKSRGNQAWIIKESGLYKVLYGENTSDQSTIDSINNHEFTYFLDSYLSLYKQIERG